MENNNTNRRKFLKKAVYAAPAVMALGALSTSAHATVAGPAGSQIYTGSNGANLGVIPGTGSTTVLNSGGVVTIPATDPNFGDFSDFLNNPLLP